MFDPALVARFQAVLDARSDHTLEVAEVSPLAGGACQDSYRVVVTTDGVQEVLVLRSDAASSLPGSIKRRDEFAVIEAARAVGVKTPRVRWLCEDLVRPGASAYFMDWADGVALGGKVVAAPELAKARETLPELLAAQLVAIHSVPLESLCLAEPDRPPVSEVGVIDAALALHRQGLDALPASSPALELALEWLDHNRPPPDRVVLCHGDFRTGNFLVTPNGLSAVLDWEFARPSSLYDDIGWLSVRDWRFGAIDRPAFGLSSRARFYDAYEKAGGQAIDTSTAFYWEVMGNVRWAVGALHQGHRYRTGIETDIELIAIGRRAIELEYEVLRLIERGPL